MTQESLCFDTHGANLDRVKSRIAGHVTAFCRSRVASGEDTFHAEDLLRWVRERLPSIAPDSPRRILGELRLEGALNYEVLNRRASLYRILSVAVSP